MKNITISHALILFFLFLFFVFMPKGYAMDIISYKSAHQVDLDATIAFLLDNLDQSHSEFLSQEEMDREVEQKKATIEERLMAASQTNDKYFGAATHHGTIIGAVSARLVDSTAFIDYLFVDAEHRSKGIGPQLARGCITNLYRTNNFSKIGLQVYEKNERALAKYLREGFKKTGQKEKGGTIAWIMERNLTLVEKCTLWLNRKFYS